MDRFFRSILSKQIAGISRHIKAIWVYKRNSSFRMNIVEYVIFRISSCIEILVNDAKIYTVSHYNVHCEQFVPQFACCCCCS